MPAAMVQRAIEQARSRDAFVYAAALVFGSRVLASLDKQAAKRTYVEGVSAAEDLPLMGRDREVFFVQIVELGAIAHPATALLLFRRTLRVETPAFRWASAASMLARGLADHGELDAAVELLRDPICIPGLGWTWSNDPPVQRRLLLAARDGWRARRQQPEHWQPRSEHFYHWCSQYWRSLERGEAGQLLDEVLSVIRGEPDYPARYRFGRIQFVESHAAAQLFIVFNVIRALKPAEDVRTLLAAYPELEHAVEIYPLGIESMRAEPQSAPAGPSFSRSGGGSDRGNAQAESMMGALRGDPNAVRHLLNLAHEAYRQDTDPGNPNLMPRVFWPSCEAYKVALYFAGKGFGMEAVSHLDKIPDGDFQVLASIELAAAVAGLTQWGGITMSQRQPEGASDHAR